MDSFLALFFYIDYKCRLETVSFATVVGADAYLCMPLSSPWRPLLCPVLGVCPPQL